MATTTVSDAVVIPQSQGTGLGSEDDLISAASASLLASHEQGEYVGAGMGFTGHDATNDTVDVAAGYCYIEDDSTSTGGMRGSGGNPQIQSSATSGYDTEIPNNQVYLVIFPTSVTISCSDSVLNQIWINITDVTSNNAVEVRSDGGGGTTAAPSDTFLKLGEANPDDSTADTRAADNPTVTYAAMTTDDYTLNHVGAKMYLSTNQSLSSGTWTKLNLDTDQFDDEDISDTTNNSVDLPAAGKWKLYAQWQWNGGADGSNLFFVDIMVNGTEQAFARAAPNANFATLECEAILELSENDTITARARQDSGASQDAVSGVQKTFMEVTKVG